MADDASSITGARVAAEELTKVNDVVQTVDGNDRLPKAQRVLLGFSEGEGLLRDASAANPLPVTAPAVVAALATLSGFVDALEANTTGLATQGTLAQVKTALDAINANTDCLEGFTDGLEGLLTALNGLLTTQAGYLDGLETALAAKLATKQTGVAPPLGYGQVAALTASAALPTIPTNSVTALIVPEAAIRWRDDGQAPTASVGMKLAAGQPLAYQGSLSAFRMVAVTGSVEVNVSFYGAEA